MALVRAYEGWKDAEREGSAYEYCWRNFLSAQTLQAIHSLRKQFSFILRDASLLEEENAANNKFSHNQSLVRAVICSGLYPGIASAHRETSMSFKTMDDGQVLLYATKLNGTNFVDWQRNLSIVLRMDEKEYVLEKPIPPAPPANASKAVKDAYEKHVKDDNQKELATDLIRQSLPELYKGFVMIYMMHDLDKPLPELLKMLQTAEENLTKGKGASVLMLQGGKGKPKKGIKIKARTVGKPKSKSTSSATQKPVRGVAKGKCHHWRRNCKTYLATKKKEGTTISSEVYVIEVGGPKVVRYKV
ncbi:unnamed protein product [Cuscuta campestris]|uniref:Uncharacterized protein n=1 Tax=Cuscuta campestris TaxID=132261 RepID=A0A484MMJ0_9ASTE|nr:unnamed protein product [Cuscuta campestris]